MPADHRRRLFGVAVETLLMLVVVGFAVHIAYEFYYRGFLIQPFQYDPSDTVMDWYNVAFWVQPGAYDIWRAVYPPLTFVILGVLRLPECYRDDPFWARDCDWIGHVAIIGMYVAAVGTVAFAFWRDNRATAPTRALAFAFGLPTLYALERGNVILICLVFFVLAYAELTRSRWVRWCSAAVTLNFKPYLVLPLLSLALKRDWRGLEVIGFLTLILLELTFAIFGQGNPLVIYQNLALWSQNANTNIWQSFFYTTTYAPLLNAQALHTPLLKFIPSRLVETLLWIAPVVIGISQVITVFAVAATWLYPKAVPRHRVALLLLAVGLVSQSWGGYTQVLLIFLVFLERFERPGPVIAILCAYILSIPGEYFLTSFGIGNSIKENSDWLSGRSIEHQLWIGLGQLLRPGFVAIILWSLALDTIALTMKAARRGPPLLGFRRQPVSAAGAVRSA